MGSQEEAAEPVQQPVREQQSAGAPSPDNTRRAAAPYFSRTVVVTSSAGASTVGGIVSVAARAASALFVSVQQSGPQHGCVAVVTGRVDIGRSCNQQMLICWTTKRRCERGCDIGMTAVATRSSARNERATWT